MTKKEFYEKIRYLRNPEGLSFRLRNLKHFENDPVFINGQMWQIDNEKMPYFSLTKGFLWSNYSLSSSKLDECTLSKDIFCRLSGERVFLSDNIKCDVFYETMQEAEADLAQVLWKIGKPLIIQLTPTGFEMV